MHPDSYFELRAGCDASEDEIRVHVRERLAGLEVPKRVIVAELPKTSAAKIQKAVLRARSRTLAPGRGRL
jgi:fatty-acyl-CoA synthase